VRFAHGGPRRVDAVQLVGDIFSKKAASTILVMTFRLPNYNFVVSFIK
jgi:hypothetical protein